MGISRPCRTTIRETNLKKMNNARCLTNWFPIEASRRHRSNCFLFQNYVNTNTLEWNILLSCPVPFRKVLGFEMGGTRHSSRKTLAHVVKPSNYLARATGLTPLSIKKKKNGSYIFYTTRRSVKFCVLAFFLTYFTSYLAYMWVYRRYKDLYLTGYLVTRISIVMLAHGRYSHVS